MFITLEGIDGTGKSTAAELLAKTLDIDFLATPGRAYESIRKVATSNRYARYHYYVSSNYYVSELSKKRDLICDRYIHSTLAYNWPFLGMPYPNDPFSAYEGLVRPDLTFLLCASDKTRRTRLWARKLNGGNITALDHDWEGQNRAQRVYESFPGLIRIDTDGKDRDTVLYEMLDIMKQRCSDLSIMEHVVL